MSWLFLSLLGCGGSEANCPLLLNTDRAQRLSLDVGETQIVRVPFRGKRVEKLGLEAGAGVEAVFADGLTTLAGPVFDDGVDVAFTCTSAGVDHQVLLIHTSKKYDDADCTAEYLVTCTEPDPTGTTGTTPPTSTIPPGTTDCVVDADGCLVSDYDRCTLVLDEPVADDARVLVAGVLPNDALGLSAIDVAPFSTTPYGYFSTDGPGCGTSRSTGSDTVSLTIYDRYRVQQDAQSVDTAGGDIAVTVDCDMDNTAGDIDMNATINGIPAPSLTASALPPSPDNQAVIEIFRSRVCGVEVQ